MKQILFFIIIFIGIITKSFGQNDFGKKFKVIAPINKSPKIKKEIPAKTTIPPEVDIPPINKPNVFKNPEIFNPNPKPSIQLTKPSTLSMTQKNDFVNPGDTYRDQMEKDMGKTLVREGLKEDSRYLVKVDVNFGEIRTKSKYFIIRYRDFGAIDGDLIKAIFNNSIIVNSVQLESSYQEFRIIFNEGFNVLKLEALNRGTLGGNTGEFQIYDAEGKFITSQFWENWDTGVKGTFKIYKE